MSALSPTDLSRPAADASLLDRWWRSVDRWTLAAVCVLAGFGYVLVLAASPSVAVRIDIARDTFIIKQVEFLAAALVVVVVTSMLSPRGVRRVALLGCVIAIALTALTLVSGAEIKGARRWVSFAGFTMQPSEFLKPCFAVIAAWLLAEGNKEAAWLRRMGWHGTAVLTALVICALLRSQPDIGMLAVVVGVFCVQMFLNGINIYATGGLLGLIAAGGVAAYYTIEHVRSRVDRFLHPAAGDNWQVHKALQAFGAGGLLGRGPGEGHVKDLIPDAHADFVFAVAGEEFGMIVCMVIIALFAFVVLKALLRLLHERDMYVVLATAGLAAGFGLQAFINMGSTLRLIPTKGMTLPFISYGGSSAIAIAVGIGMLLALTRKRGDGA